MYTHVFYSFDHAAVKKAKKHFDAPARLDENGPWFTQQAIICTLNQALDQRASLLTPQLEPTPNWSVVEKPPNPYEQSLVLGLALDPEHALALLTKGPSANLPEAKIFREFWGDKSELRRFQDGSVSEAVVWSGGGMARRRLICREIVQHVANRHMGLSAGDVLYIADQFQSVLDNSTGEEGSLACTKVGFHFMGLSGD
jgi:U3 small nucleolar RNA-associated protein 22